MKKLKNLQIAIVSSFLLTKAAFAKPVDVDTILPPASETSGVSGGYNQINAVKNLPDVSLEGAVATFIKTLLGWSFIIALVAIVTAGIYYLVFEGEEEKVSKAKNMIVYLVIGMIIISAAYGIVSGLLRIKFF